jgi:dihydropyrimidinase
MTLLIQNGHIVTATDSYVADILCAGGKIVAIGQNLAAAPGDEIVDATGQYVFPGFIDPHVHIHLPFMGTAAKDDYASAGRAAVVGGTTTLIEMCCPSRDEDPLEAFELWKSKAEGLSACDYSFHMGVTRFDETTAGKLREIVERGVASFKVFLAYRDFFGIDDRELFATLELARELGVIVTAHCENATLVAERQRQLLAEGKTGPEWHERSRPVGVERAGVEHLAAFAESTGTHVYIVHTSCREALRAAERARGRGVKLWIETVIPYLVLDDTFAQREDFEGAKYVMSPPIRDKSHQGALWNALASRSIGTVATDHAPFDFKGQKELGRGDFTKIPNGLPGIEERINLLYTYGVKRGHIDLHTLVDAGSTQAAKIFGLFPRKGTIALGSDADLVVYDPTWRGNIAAATQQSQTDYNPYEGWTLEGRPSLVTVRGEVQARDGEFVGQAGWGEFLPREATH